MDKYYKSYKNKFSIIYYNINAQGTFITFIITIVSSIYDLEDL